MKRKILFTSCLLTMTGFLSAQNFGAIGTQWYYNNTNENVPPNSAYQHFQSVSDTLINGELTHKIARTYYQPNGTIVTAKPLYVFERSDTAFIYNFEKGRFLKLFIFNASQGDTLILDVLDTFPPWDTTYRVIINSVEVLMIKGIPIKKYNATVLVDGNGNFYSVGHSFMDRIGWLNHFFPDYMPHLPIAGGTRCYSDPQIDTNFQSVACTYWEHLSVAEINSQFKMSVFPNPAGDYISLNINESYDYRIMDVMGRVVLSGVANEKILLSNILPGLYFISIDTGNAVLTQKFIKE